MNVAGSALGPYYDRCGSQEVMLVHCTLHHVFDFIELVVAFLRDAGLFPEDLDHTVLSVSLSSRLRTKLTFLPGLLAVLSPMVRHPFTSRLSDAPR